MCNCKATEIVLGLIILVFALWQTMYSNWIIVVAAALLIIHGFMCKTMSSRMSMQTSKPAAKKKAVRKKAARRRKR